MPSDRPTDSRITGGGGGAHFLRQALADLENFLGAGEGRLAGIGQGHAASGRLEQLMPQVALQFAHLGADGLDGHVQPFGGAEKPPSLATIQK